MFYKYVCMDSKGLLLWKQFLECGSKFENNRGTKKEFPERIIGEFKSIIDLRLQWNVTYQISS